MKKMICPITGTVLYIADERVDKYKKAGYKLATGKGKGKAAKAEPEPEPEPEPEQEQAEETAE